MLRYIPPCPQTTNQQDQLLAQAASGQDMFIQATAMQLLCREHGFTQSQLSKRLGISQATVGNKIRLLQYSPSERQALLHYGLSERHARALLVVLPPKRAKMIETAGSLHLNVRQTEELAEKYRNQSTEEVSARHPIICGRDLSVEHFFDQTNSSIERLRATGIKIAYTAEHGDGWRRLTVTIKDDNCFT